MKNGTKFRYIAHKLDFKAEIKEFIEGDSRVWFRVISTRIKGMVKPGETYNVTLNSFKENAKILDEITEPISTYENKNKEKITNTLRKTK